MGDTLLHLEERDAVRTAPSLLWLLAIGFLLVGCPADESIDDDTAMPDDDVSDDDAGDDDTAASPCADFSVAAAAVDADELMETLTYLTSFPRRDGFDEQDEILDELAVEVEEYGAAVDFHSYSHAGQTHRNLIATVPASASLDPDVPHLLIGAHVDSTSEPTAQLAPGADDNASGVAAVLEAVRILAQCELPTRIDFVFFTNEEIGTVGSEAYAADAVAAEEDIVGMIAVDMVAYGPPGEDLDVATKSQMSWLALSFLEGVEAYTGTQTFARIDDHCG